MAENQVNLYRIKTEKIVDNVKMIETYHMAACSLEEAIRLFTRDGVFAHIIYAEELELVPGEFYYF